jgi:1-acyl-sn-glycerol-3-phosphate acyltransferase
MNRLIPSPRQFFFVQRVFRLMAAPLLEWHVAGLENIPRHGPLLVALNHTSFLDVILPALFFPRPLVTFAKAEAFHSPVYGWLLRWMQIVPLRRGEVDRAALGRALQVLQNGGAFAVAPEGTRTREGKLIRAKAGIALLATATRAPVLPLAMWGAGGDGFFRNLSHFHRTRVEAVIGPPLQLRDAMSIDHRARQAIADDLMLHIARLLPEPLRGYYSNPSDFPDCFFEPLGSGAVPHSLPHPLVHISSRIDQA